MELGVIQPKSYSERNPDKFGIAVVLGFVAAGVSLTTFATEADATTQFSNQYQNEGQCLYSLGYTHEAGAFPYRRPSDTSILKLSTDAGNLPNLEFRIERTTYLTIEGFSPANEAARIALQECGDF